MRDGGPEFCPLPSSFNGLLIPEEESIGGLLFKGTPFGCRHQEWKGHIMKTNTSMEAWDIDSPPLMT